MPEELNTLLVTKLEGSERGNHGVRFVDHFILRVFSGFLRNDQDCFAMGFKDCAQLFCLTPELLKLIEAFNLSLL